MRSKQLLITLIVLLVAACTPPPPAPKLTVSVIVDNRNLNYEYTEPVTVAEFLREIEIELGELDLVNPPLYTQIYDQMVITVRRIEEKNECTTRETPYQRRTIIDETISPDNPEGVLAQKGENGEERVCYRIEIRDGVEQAPVQVGDPVPVTLPKDEIYRVPPPTTLDPVEVVGTIAYISRGNAWVMRGSNQLSNRRPITDTGDLDERVFSLSGDGKQLLFTRKTQPGSEFNNQLWLIADVTAEVPQAIKLRPENVLYADWLPGETNTITYSQADPQATAPGWRARNNLQRSLIDPETGEEISITTLVEEYSGDLSGWWGTGFYWSPDGERLAYVHANAVGIVNLETGERTPLLTYEVFTPYSNWSWRTSVSWSPDSSLLVTTVHGPPIGPESPQRSPIFNIAFASPDAGFSATMIEQSGIWSNPRFSPYVVSSDNEFPQAYLAYMLARQPLDSLGEQAAYDLYVADRDGSNSRKIFPQEGQSGILLSREYAWSPDGRQIVVVYQGNLFTVDVESGLARQLTLDGSVSKPVWTR